MRFLTNAPTRLTGDAIACHAFLRDFLVAAVIRNAAEERRWQEKMEQKLTYISPPSLCPCVTSTARRQLNIIMQSATDISSGQSDRVAVDSNSTRRKRPVGNSPAAVVGTRAHTQCEVSTSVYVVSASSTSGANIRGRVLLARTDVATTSHVVAPENAQAFAAFSPRDPSHTRHAQRSGLSARIQERSIRFPEVRSYMFSRFTTLCIFAMVVLQTQVTRKRMAGSGAMPCKTFTVYVALPLLFFRVELQMTCRPKPPRWSTIMG